MKELESIYQPTENDKYKGYLLYTPQIGNFFLIKPST